jgi:hypothetical protein
VKYLFSHSHDGAKAVNRRAKFVTSTWVECEALALQIGGLQEIGLASTPEKKMKTFTKFVAASILALSAIAPAFAGEEDTLLERNTYNATTSVRHVRHNGVKAHHAVDAFAFAPAGIAGQNGQNFGIESQR